MSSLSFFSLPAEIRNRIYGFCTPLNAHIDEFEGLLLASRQVRHEYETEALKVLQRFLDCIKRQWPHSEELRFLKPVAFRDLHKMTVQLPVSLYFPKSRSEEWSKLDALHKTKMEDCLAPLFTLYLSRLTFTFYDDRGSFVNWTPWIIPTGLLLDLLNPLAHPVSRLHLNTSGTGSTRIFQFYDTLHIRELAYSWNNSKVAHESNLNSLVQADVETANFFLHESHLFQEPFGLVHNWGRGTVSIWFDLRTPA